MKQMIIGMELGNLSGTKPDAWRAPGVDPTEYLNYDTRIRYAKAAERGKLQFLFFPNGPYHEIEDFEHYGPDFTPDLGIHVALLARATRRIGFVASGSTQYNHPYALAQQMKTLDYISHGRVAWNVVASGFPDVAANYGSPVASSEDRYARARESIELVQSLWASWGLDAWVHDQETGQYTKPGQVSPVDFDGTYVNSRGPLYIPPSEQGQPVIVQSGLGADAFELAGRYADLAIGFAYTIEEARECRDAIRRYAAEAGRDPDEVKYVPGFSPTVGTTEREALDRRFSLMTSRLPQLVEELGSLLSVPLSMEDLDRVFDPAELGPPHAPNPEAPGYLQVRPFRANALASSGWSVRDIIAHGIFDKQPSAVGTAEQVADHMQEWFESGAVDGFWICVDVYQDGIDAFVDRVIPILQDRGVFHRDYEGATLREHLGVHDQYGPDFRVARTARPRSALPSRGVESNVRKRGKQ